MFTIIVRTLATATLVMPVFAGFAAAQTAPSPVLNTLEVRKLVASADSADNARLAAQFMALSERYAAEAKRHTAMAQPFIGSPARRVAVCFGREGDNAGDHRALEEYFQTAARRYSTDANEHAAMAQAYRGTRIAQAAAHCDRLVRMGRKAAKEATELAAQHKQLADVAR